MFDGYIIIYHELCYTKASAVAFIDDVLQVLIGFNSDYADGYIIAEQPDGDTVYYILPSSCYAEVRKVSIANLFDKGETK